MRGPIEDRWGGWEGTSDQVNPGAIDVYWHVVLFTTLNRSAFGKVCLHSGLGMKFQKLHVNVNQ